MSRSYTNVVLIVDNRGSWGHSVHPPAHLPPSSEKKLHAKSQRRDAAFPRHGVSGENHLRGRVQIIAFVLDWSFKPHLCLRTNMAGQSDRQWKITFQEALEPESFKTKLETSVFFKRCAEPKSVAVDNMSVVFTFVSPLKRQGVLQKCSETFKRYGRYQKHEVVELGAPGTPSPALAHCTPPGDPSNMQQLAIRRVTIEELPPVVDEEWERLERQAREEEPTDLEKEFEEFRTMRAERRRTEFDWTPIVRSLDIYAGIKSGWDRL